MLLRPFAVLLACALGVCLPSLASAELVTLTTGRTMSVRSVRVDGETAVLVLRSGGELECAVTLIKSVAPDEVPYPEPELEAPIAVATMANPAVSLAASASADQQMYVPMIEQAAQRHRVDPRLVHALITVESRYRANARSRKGAMGLMQLMPATARELDVVDPYDPAANIEGGVRHLRKLLDRFDTRLAVAAYNAGAGAVHRFGGVPPFRETQNYVRQVLRLAGVS